MKINLTIQKAKAIIENKNMSLSLKTNSQKLSLDTKTQTTTLSNGFDYTLNFTLQ